MSIAILTRIYKYESPYLNEFIDYHLNYVKIDHIYFILTDDYDFSNIIDQSFMERITMLKNPLFSKKNNDRLFNYTIQFIKEKYVFNIDIDEFIYLNESCSLQDFIKKNSKYNLFNFKWILCPSSNYQNDSVFNICQNEQMFISDTGKSMALVNDIISIEVHSMHVINEKKIEVNIDDIFILHFSSRGIVDLLLRMLNQKFKNDTLEKINNFLNNELGSFNLLPSRIKALKLQKNNKFILNKKIITPKLNFKIDTNIENIMLSEKIIMNDKNKLIYQNNLNKKYNDFKFYENIFKKSINMS